MSERLTPERLAEIRDAVGVETERRQLSGTLRIMHDLLAHVDAQQAQIDALQQQIDGMRTIYSVQEWMDVDSIRDNWNTGYGHWTRSLDDARATLRHWRQTCPHTTFRIAQTRISGWLPVEDQT